MKNTHQLPDGLSFPTPPGRIDRAVERMPFRPTVAATYLTEILRWRDAVAKALATGDRAIEGVDHLTPRARARLALLLRTSWDVATRLSILRSGYGLTPFPAPPRTPRAGDPMLAVLQVLRWRAAVVNHLTEVWDVLGKPELQMAECAAIGMFIRPARLEGRCVYCLTEYGPGHIDPAVHDCVMVSEGQSA
jgi:hypothetical protein